MITIKNRNKSFKILDLLSKIIRVIGNFSKKKTKNNLSITIANLVFLNFTNTIFGEYFFYYTW